MIDDPAYWPLIFPYIFRIGRCWVVDKGALEYITVVFEKELNSVTNFYGSDNKIPNYAGSYLLFYIIMYSELYDQSWTVANENTQLSTSLFPVSAVETINRHSFFSKYIYQDPLANKFPTSTTPMSRILIQNGDIDTRTPLSWAKYYSSQTSSLLSSKFVMYNSSAHTLIIPDSNPTNNTHTCSIQTFADFIIQSPVEPDQHPCLKEMYPYRVSVNDSKDLFDELGILLEPYEGGIFPASFALVIIILIISLSICSCITAIVSYFAICKKYDAEIPIQYTLM